jgi:hypothetical protein
MTLTSRLVHQPAGVSKSRCKYGTGSLHHSGGAGKGILPTDLPQRAPRLPADGTDPHQSAGRRGALRLCLLVQSRLWVAVAGVRTHGINCSWSATSSSLKRICPCASSATRAKDELGIAQTGWRSPRAGCCRAEPEVCISNRSDTRTPSLLLDEQNAQKLRVQM